MAKSDDDSDQDRKLPARKSKLNTDDVSTGSDMTHSFRRMGESRASVSMIAPNDVAVVEDW